MLLEPFCFWVLCKLGLKPSSLACQAIVLVRWTTNTTCPLTSLTLKLEIVQLRKKNKVGKPNRIKQCYRSPATAPKTCCVDTAAPKWIQLHPQLVILASARTVGSIAYVSARSIPQGLVIE